MTLPKNFVVLDCETSGLDPARHALLSVGAVTASGREFYRECLFDETREVDPAAMAVNGINLALTSADDVWPEQAVLELLAFLREEHDGKWLHGGKNPKFDRDFLHLAAGPALQEQLGTTLSRRTIDVHSWAYLWAFGHGIDCTAPEFCTDVIYAHLGFAPEEKPHQALRGAQHAMAIFRALATASFVPVVRGAGNRSAQEVAEIAEKTSVASALSCAKA